jgi:SRSO17 transposase
MTTALAPDAWVIDDTGFPKFGRYSVGVAPQYCGALGKVANCQVGVSVHAVTEQASCPLDWRLFLPESWDDDAERRRKAHVPDRERHRPKWQLALELLDELAAWDLVVPVVLADAAYGEVGEFRLGLEQRQLAYVVQVPATISAYPQHVAPEQGGCCVAPTQGMLNGDLGPGSDHQGQLFERDRQPPVAGSSGASS